MSTPPVHIHLKDGAIPKAKHNPIPGIVGDRDLCKVHNPCLFRLKEKCLRYSFSIQHFPGKRHKGADAASCNPVAVVEALVSLCPTLPSSEDVHLSDKIDAVVQAATIQATTMLSWHLTTTGRQTEVTISTQSSYTPSTRDSLINVLSQNPVSTTSGRYDTDSALTEA